MSSKARQSQQQWLVDQAIAQQTLEGLKVPQDIVEMLNFVADNKLTCDDVLKKAYEKFSDGQILIPRPLP
jgi:hypothetical protein